MLPSLARFNHKFIFGVSILVKCIFFTPPSQDVAAYRAKGKTGASAPGKAPAKAEKKEDDDDDDDEDDEEEEDYDDDDDE